MVKLAYPATRVGDDVETAAGVSFADPYRWLQSEDAEVLAWQSAQNRLADQYMSSWPHQAELQRSIAHYYTDRIGNLPRHVAGNWFRAEQACGSSPACVVVSATPFGDGRKLAIPAVEAGGVPPFINWVAPSPDGRIVAAGVCSDGSENNRIHLIDAASGEILARAPPQVLMDAWMGGVCWLADSSGFYFLALQGLSHSFQQTVLLHDLASGTQSAANIPLPDSDSSDYTLVTLSRSGRYFVASHGLFAPKPVAIRDLAETGAPWRSFVTQAAGTVAGFIDGNAFIAVTDVGAPRGRIVAIPLDAADPCDASQWSELLPESSMVLRSVSPIGGDLYVTGFVDTYSRLGVLDRRHRRLIDIPLPACGAIAEPIFPLMNQVPAGHPEECYFVFSSLIQSWGVYRHRPGTAAIETVRAPQVSIENAVVKDHWATSSDGTRVPYHTVHLSRVESTLPAPALIHAYGAFNLPLLPEYPSAMAAFIAAGGIYVHGHIRGGAELGLDWWHGGRMKNKQNCYQDLYAIAESLIEKGLTTRAQLAMTGRSNGGLMAGVAAAQRPQLWKAIVSQVPVTDLIGILHDPYGRYALQSEYGDPGDPEEIVRMAGFSPYHLVTDGTEYPAIFIEAGATDPRCPPWHARKFAARLQAAGATNQSLVLLRVRANAGHGPATAKALQVESYAEWLAFLMRQLDMQP